MWQLKVFSYTKEDGQKYLSAGVFGGFIVSEKSPKSYPESVWKCVTCDGCPMPLIQQPDTEEESIY